MYTHMRREDRMLKETDAHQIIEKGSYGVLSITAPDGTPYALPVSYALVDNTIYIHGTNKGGLRYEFSQKTNRASFVVVGEAYSLPERFSMHYTSAVVSGSLCEITDNQEKRTALVAFLQKYAAQHMADGLVHIDDAIDRTAIFALQIEVLNGKGNLAQ